jgi:hypothetical protein
MLICVTLHGQKGQCCPTQVQALAFKTKIPLVSAILGFKGWMIKLKICWADIKFVYVYVRGMQMHVKILQNEQQQ